VESEAQSPEAYEVLRHEATEYPGTSPLLNEHRAGTFSCAGCDLPLFDAATKYESGTGWPSFYQPLENAVGESTDIFWATPALRCIAAVVAAISAMCSTMARRPPVCATA
jgi:peptide methionine sulfoxide reductase MsrB